MPKWITLPFAEGHDAADFDCGNPTLSDWIRQYAGQHERRGLARTYVLVRPGESRVMGYYALATTSIQFDVVPSKHAKKLPRRSPIPAVLIGRLAVDRSLHGQGLGAVLLIDAMRKADSVAGQVGVQSIVVHAMDDEVKGFYTKRGFEELLDDPRHLFIPMPVVRRLLQAIELPPE